MGRIMLELEPGGHCGSYGDHRSGQHVTPKGRNTYVVTILKTKRDRDMITTEREYEVMGCLSFAALVGVA